MAGKAIPKAACENQENVSSNIQRAKVEDAKAANGTSNEDTVLSMAAN